MWSANKSNSPCTFAYRLQILFGAIFRGAKSIFAQNASETVGDEDNGPTGVRLVTSLPRQAVDKVIRVVRNVNTSDLVSKSNYIRIVTERQNSDGWYLQRQKVLRPTTSTLCVCSGSFSVPNKAVNEDNAYCSIRRIVQDPNSRWEALRCSAF